MKVIREWLIFRSWVKSEIDHLREKDQGKGSIMVARDRFRIKKKKKKEKYKIFVITPYDDIYSIFKPRSLIKKIAFFKL